MERKWSEVPFGKLWDTRLRVGQRVLEVSVLVPKHGSVLGTIVEAPGMTAKRRCYAALSNEYARLGWATVSLAHQDASGCYLDEVAAALDEVVNDHALPRYGERLVAQGHSKGAINVVQALHDQPSRADQALLMMPAGFGGVGLARAPLSLMHAPVGVAREIAHIAASREIADDAKAVVREAGIYVARSPLLVAKLALDAMRTQVQREARELIETGVPVGVVLGRDDGLIHHGTVQRQCEILGIPTVSLAVPYAGHNAQMYVPGAVAEATMSLIGHEPLQKTA